MEAAAALAMDFHALSRRELQALCKRNGVRANMTNAAMADALQGLTSVDGIDEIGTTLCLATPGRSTMKSAAKAAAVAGEEEQQHGSPLPRGRRVSVMSPAAIRMDVMEGDDELKRDLVKEIIKTPGVALRSTSRRARATTAPLPTPATLRRSTRATARKAAVPVEAENLVEEVSTVKRTTRRTSARSMMMLDLDQEEEVVAATPKVQQEELKAVASDVKCDDPVEEEEEVTKLLEGDNKEEEPEEGEEADSSDATNGSALVSEKSCDDAAVEQEATKPQEGAMEEQEPVSAEKSAPLEPMEDSPILGVLSKAEATESVIEKTQDASVEPVNEMTDEINPAVEDKAVAVGEEVDKEDCFTVTGEAVHFAEEILQSAQTSEEKEEAEPTEDGTSEEDELDEDEESSSDDETSEEIDSTDESDEDNDEANEEGDFIEVRIDFNNVKEELVQMMQDTGIAEDARDDSAEDASEDDSDEQACEDGSAEDDFTSDLPPEFHSIVVLSDAETESDAETDNTPSVLEENQVAAASGTKESQVAAASATKTSVKSLDDSAISLTNEEDVSEEDVSEEAVKEVASTFDTIVKSLDEFTMKEGTHQAEENIGSEAVGPKGQQVDYNAMSMRKLKSTLKDCLAAKQECKKHAEAKRLPLEEVDDNACSDC